MVILIIFINNLIAILNNVSKLQTTAVNVIRYDLKSEFGFPDGRELSNS